MFQTGDLVVYENHGVYRIEDVGTLGFTPDQNKEYYTLSAPYSKDNTVVYIPVDYKGYLQNVMEKSQAQQYLAELQTLEALPIEHLKNARLIESYKEILASHDIRKYLKTLKGIHLKKKASISKKRKIGQIDLKYEQMIQQMLCQEFAAALDQNPDRIQEILKGAIEKSEVIVG